MTWFRVDDSLAFHEKVVAAGNPAMGLWVRAGAWCSQQLTDGLVKSHMLASLGTKQQAENLVNAGLWLRDGDDYRFHDWHQANPLRVDVEAERAAAKERMRVARQARRSGARSEVVRPNTGRSSAAVAVTPTRPDPTRPIESPTDSPPVASLPDRFDEFWQVYPRRVGRGQAVKAWKTATKKTAADVILTAAASYASSIRGTDAKFIPHPATWLNGERWLDERQLRVVNDEAWYPGKGGSWDV